MFQLYIYNYVFIVLPIVYGITYAFGQRPIFRRQKAVHTNNNNVDKPQSRLPKLIA